MIDSLQVRNIILNIIDDITNKKKHSHSVLKKYLDINNTLNKQQRAFIKRIVEGTLEHLILLDYIINKFSKLPTNKMKPTIRNILRISVYQIRFMDSIPVSATCNEAVKLTKKRGFEKLSGFVNGVLRNIARNIDLIKLPSEKEDKLHYLSINYSIPSWILKLWLSQYDYAIVKKMCNASNQITKTTIRCNQLKTTPSKLLQILNNENVSVNASQLLPYAFKIYSYDNLEKLHSFKKGLYTVQDEASMLVAEIASPSINDYVIDVCSAPGGKTTHISEIVQQGHVVARDISDSKNNLTEENINRLGLKNVTIQQFDALKLDKENIEKADIVLADLPCSGLGIIRKKPDIKYNLNEKQIKELIKLQRNILSVIFNYLKPKGILIYSTCTINKKENHENVEWLTNNFPLKKENVAPYVPIILQKSIKDGMLELLPGYHNTDGFFIARLRRI